MAVCANGTVLSPRDFLNGFHKRKVQRQKVRVHGLTGVALNSGRLTCRRRLQAPQPHSRDFRQTTCRRIPQEAAKKNEKRARQEKIKERSEVRRAALLLPKDFPLGSYAGTWRMLAALTSRISPLAAAQRRQLLKEARGTAGAADDDVRASPPLPLALRPGCRPAHLCFRPISQRRLRLPRRGMKRAGTGRRRRSRRSRGPECSCTGATLP